MADKATWGWTPTQGPFDCKAWVYVSQEFRAREILLAIALQVMFPDDEEKGKLEERRETSNDEKKKKIRRDE